MHYMYRKTKPMAINTKQRRSLTNNPYSLFPGMEGIILHSTHKVHSNYGSVMKRL